MRAPHRRRVGRAALRRRLRDGALKWVDEGDLPEGAERLDEGSRVYYLNLPKRWVAGEVYDELRDEVLIGATVTIQGEDGATLKAETDEFGDFWFRQVPAQKYHVWYEAEGYVTKEGEADATEADAHVGSVPMYTMDFK